MNDLKDLSTYLGNIEENIESAIIKAQRETAESICQDAKNLAPKDTGRYAESIHVTDTQVLGNNVLTSIVTDATVTAKSNGNEYNLGKLLEEGTNPHEIRPVEANVLHFQIDGEDIFAKLVHHPGFAPLPHFVPALWLNQDVYQENIAKVLDKEFK